MQIIIVESSSNLPGWNSVKLNDLDLLYFHRAVQYNEVWGRVLI